MKTVVFIALAFVVAIMLASPAYATTPLPLDEGADFVEYFWIGLVTTVGFLGGFFVGRLTSRK
jgi:hypothetical protein